MDPGGGDHAAVADQRHPFDPEPAADLFDLGGDAGGVGGNCRGSLEGYRAAVGGTQETADDPLAVTSRF